MPGILEFLLILSRPTGIHVHMNSINDIAVEMREADWKRYLEWVLSESIGEDEIRAGYEREEIPVNRQKEEI